MPDTIITLSEKDVALLRSVLDRVRRDGPPKGSSPVPLTEGGDYLPPEVHLALAPAGGIPATSGTTLGSAECPIHRVTDGVAEDSGLTRVVYNAGPAVPGGALVQAHRDKFGTWLVGAAPEVATDTRTFSGLMAIQDHFASSPGYSPGTIVFTPGIDADGHITGIYVRWDTGIYTASQDASVVWDLAHTDALVLNKPGVYLLTAGVCMSVQDAGSNIPVVWGLLASIIVAYSDYSSAGVVSSQKAHIGYTSSPATASSGRDVYLCVSGYYYHQSVGGPAHARVAVSAGREPYAPGIRAFVEAAGQVGRTHFTAQYLGPLAGSSGTIITTQPGTTTPPVTTTQGVTTTAGATTTTGGTTTTFSGTTSTAGATTTQGGTTTTAYQNGIVGYVLGSDGSPITSVGVVVQASATSGTWSSSLSPNGSYQILGIPPDTYTVTVVGLPANCSASPSPALITVPASGYVGQDFQVSCT